MPYYKYKPRPPKPQYTYPLLMRQGNTGIIVNMTRECVGVVVGTGQSEYRPELGKHSNEWRMSAFKPYLPKIFKVKGML